MLDTVTTDVMGFLGGESLESIAQHQFFIDAAAHGLFDPTTTGLTIFLPLQYSNIDDFDDEFEEFFNRHVVIDVYKVGDDGVKQLKTLSESVVIAVYSLDGSNFSVAGVPLKSDLINCSLQGCIVHCFDAKTLPALRPVADDIAQMRTMYLSGEEFELRFEELGIEDPDTNDQTFTLLVSFTLNDRKVISDVQKTAWLGNGTSCNIVIPNIDTQTMVMMWIYLYDNKHRHSILTMLWPWHMTLVPNVDMQPNPEILHIVPKKAHVNEELCILGHNFSNTDIRVSIGPNSAYIIFCNSEIIRCFIPAGSGKNPVWVANGNVYKRFDCFTYSECNCVSNS